MEGVLWQYVCGCSSPPVPMEVEEVIEVNPDVPQVGRGFFTWWNLRAVSLRLGGQRLFPYPTIKTDPDSNLAFLREIRGVPGVASVPSGGLFRYASPISTGGRGVAARIDGIWFYIPERAWEAYHRVASNAAPGEIDPVLALFYLPKLELIGPPGTSMVKPKQGLAAMITFGPEGPKFPDNVRYEAPYDLQEVFEVPLERAVRLDTVGQLIDYGFTGAPSAIPAPVYGAPRIPAPGGGGLRGRSTAPASMSNIGPWILLAGAGVLVVGFLARRR